MSFPQICTIVMYLDLHQNVISTQYLENNDRITPNFIYALILTRSSLRLLHVIFWLICTRVMALDLYPNLFPLNISRTN